MKNIPLILFSLALVACESSEEKALKEFVSSQFKDPQSTQFQKVTFKNGVMCGEVNSKNGYGAYVGFKRFAAKKQIDNFTGVVEEIGIIGRDYLRLELSAVTFLTHTKINEYLVKRGELPLDYFKTEGADKVLMKYPTHLKMFEKKITTQTTEDQIEKLASEMIAPIEFMEMFKSSCPSS